MPQRRILGEIDGNRPVRKELTPIQRAQIVGAIDGGASIRETAKRLGFPYSTVRSTVKASPQRHNHQDIPRAGRPPKWGARDERFILKYARRHPKATYAQIRAEMPTPLSRETIRKILERSGIKKWMCKKRPEITDQVAYKRHMWALERKDWTSERWGTIIFSDESSIERGAGGQRQWAWRTAAQKWSTPHLQTYKKGRDLSVMVWGAIWLGGRSDLILMDIDEEAKRSGYSANSYLDVLERTIESCWEPGRTFMQDNAPIHKARKVMDWFESYGIPLLDWPPYSPDMNPIEHVWAKMKEWLVQHYPNAREWGSSQAALDRLGRVIIEAWEAVPQEFIDGLINTMTSRINSLLDAGGWHTKY
jgi:transposase